MKQSIIAIALILLLGGYYLTPSSTAENEGSAEISSYPIDTQMQPDEIWGAGYGLKKTDSASTFFHHPETSNSSLFDKLLQ